MSARRLDSAFCYARHGELADFLALGWSPTASLGGTYHGDFGVLVVWLCDCPPVLPVRFKARGLVELDPGPLFGGARV
jgi:hypothetical protein